ncbi:MAG: asparagine synthetase B, partial [Flavobacteriales bacterium]|nr:asparagine synthetase B [Flavobacteriales bacterium]
MRKFFLLILLLLNLESFSSYLLIPMDNSQTNHLKSYGIAFLSIENEVKVDWLLNYKGGSFLIKHYPEIEKEC